MGRDFDKDNVILYLHRRATPEGTSALVVIGLVLGRSPEGDNIRIMVHTSLINEASDGSYSYGEVGSYGQGSEKAFGDGGNDTLSDRRFAFYAGESDSSDDSKFTIPWVVSGHAHQMTGHLEMTDTEIGLRYLKVVLHDIP